MKKSEPGIDTQRRDILEYMRKGNSITNAVAVELFGAYRLSAIIFDLKKIYKVNIEKVTETTATGKRYARYYIG